VYRDLQGFGKYTKKLQFLDRKISIISTTYSYYNLNMKLALSAGVDSAIYSDAPVSCTNMLS
jgi:hypothetical protein